MHPPIHILPLVPVPMIITDKLYLSARSVRGTFLFTIETCLNTRQLEKLIRELIFPDSISNFYQTTICTQSVLFIWQQEFCPKDRLTETTPVV